MGTYFVFAIMRPSMAGPGGNRYKANVQDAGKFAPAGKSGDGYRMAGAAAGPNSSHANYVATQDIGKAAPAGKTGDGYRMAGAAAGPASSHTNYVATQDIGKAAPAGSSG